MNNLFFRKDIALPKIKNLQQELHIRLFEVEVALSAIDALVSRFPRKFDSLVGDCKCQTRASMIMDIMHSDFFMHNKWQQEIDELRLLADKIKIFIKDLDFDKYLQIQTFLKEMDGLSLDEYLNKKALTLQLSLDLRLIALSFFTSMVKDRFFAVKNEFIGLKKINQFLDSAKEELCRLSIDYEKTLALNYCSVVEQKSLSQIEQKAFCSMTPFFPGFKPIWHKMKGKGQSFITKIRHFCHCGGMLDQKLQLYRSKKGVFSEDPMMLSPEVVMVIEGYRYTGSRDVLMSFVDAAKNKVSMSDYVFSSCKCRNSLPITKIQNIEEVVLANFAQHPQFTNDAQIDWEGLGLVDSDLKKEFDYLNTISGCSFNDMSQFCIKHIYASTVEQVLQEQEAVQASLKQSSKVSPLSKIPGVSKPDLALI